jgi:predicted unusual protein kinase regulating ubiquinone biosynthesis (AarF/ABC1/UbiB family)
VRAQYAENLFKELDYRKEAANGQRFRELYGNLEARFVALPAHVSCRLFP